MVKAFLVKPIKFSKGKLHYTARVGTPVVILESNKRSVKILFKWFMKWVGKTSVKVE